MQGFAKKEKKIASKSFFLIETFQNYINFQLYT